MNIVILTCGPGGELATHQIQHQVGTGRAPVSRVVNLLLLDSRRMDTECFSAACAEIGVIRTTLGLNHGVLVCHAPTLPLTVAAIRAGLRDIIHQTIDATRLRALLQASNPGSRLSVKAFDAIAATLRTFGGVSASESPVVDLNRREHELARRAEQLANVETRLAFERDAIENRDRELRERTRRFERQLALQQNDADVGPAAAPSKPSTPPFNELQIMARRLEQRAAELDFREKLLMEMQAVLASAGLPTPPS